MTKGRSEITSLHCTIYSDNLNHFFIFRKNNAVKLDATLREWLDLGIHTEACLTQPDTCSSTGGSVSMWIKIGPSTYTGIITTKQNSQNVRGFNLDAQYNYIT